MLNIKEIMILEEPILIALKDKAASNMLSPQIGSGGGAKPAMLSPSGEDTGKKLVPMVKPVRERIVGSKDTSSPHPIMGSGMSAKRLTEKEVPLSTTVLAGSIITVTGSAMDSELMRKKTRNRNESMMPKILGLIIYTSILSIK